jgi:hypothetical protein
MTILRADSSVVELPLFQGEDGGAIPTSALQNLNGWIVERCLRNHIEPFIEKWHYSKSISGCTTSYCYRMFDANKLMVGAMFYGPMAMAGQYKRFSSNPNDVIELRRLCCIDGTPKNAESFFISKSLKKLSKDWNKNGIVVSYSDMEYGHHGTIYKASNFEDLGTIPGAKVIIWNGKKYHDKSLRAKYNGALKPFAKRLNEAVKSGNAVFKQTAGKHTFVYRLNRSSLVNHKQKGN